LARSARCAGDRSTPYSPRTAHRVTTNDSNHTRLRFVHHLDEEAKSEEVGPGWEYYLDRLVAAMNDNPMPGAVRCLEFCLH